MGRHAHVYSPGKKTLKNDGGWCGSQGTAPAAVEHHVQVRDAEA